MIPLAEFRDLLGPEAPPSEEELAEMRRNWSAFARVLVADFKERHAKKRAAESDGSPTPRPK